MAGLHFGQLHQPARLPAPLGAKTVGNCRTALRSASLLRVGRKETAWDIEILAAGTAKSFSGSIIVDATGRAATFARRQGARIRAHDRQIAVVALAMMAVRLIELHRVLKCSPGFQVLRRELPQMRPRNDVSGFWVAQEHILLGFAKSVIVEQFGRPVPCSEGSPLP
jgi:hypothetical protein